MHIRPVGNTVLVTYESGDVKTAAGVHIPATAQKSPNKGIVIAVGPGRALPDGSYVKPQVSVGDQVLYDKHGATGVDRNGEKLVIVNVAALIGVYE